MISYKKSFLAIFMAASLGAGIQAHPEENSWARAFEDFHELPVHKKIAPIVMGALSGIALSNLATKLTADMIEGRTNGFVAFYGYRVLGYGGIYRAEKLILERMVNKKGEYLHRC